MIHCYEFYTSPGISKPHYFELFFFHFPWDFEIAGLKKICFQTEILDNLLKYVFFCFVLLFTSSSPCRKDQFAVSYFLREDD